MINGSGSAITSKGRGRSIKLLDFGVARLFDQAGKSKLSVFGLVLGTPSFMAPEQAVGAREKVDHRTDIWSLGATLFTAITGQTVHLGPNVQAKLLAAATAKARSAGGIIRLTAAARRAGLSLGRGAAGDGSRRRDGRSPLASSRSAARPPAPRSVLRSPIC